MEILENVSFDEKDWHPRSGQQILDLVHPSLFCYVFGQTLKSSRMFDPTSCSSPAEQMHQLMFNGSDIVEGPDGSDIAFQWIPTDLTVTQGGDDNGFKVRCLSYINSLHPEQHKDMYKSIEDIFAKFVSLLPDVINLPQKSKVSLRGKTLQAIVKVADIIFTPENPWYRGGEWHIEGTPAENINITASRLALRAEIEEPFYQQNDDSGVAGTFGLFHGDRLIQEFGLVQAMTSRCVVFPNSLQHRVEPFELEYHIRPGRRKILAFFLVDFNKPIPSTSVNSPQHQAWRECGFELMIEKCRLVDVGEQNIRVVLLRGMSLAQAKKHCLDLMEERTAEGAMMRKVMNIRH
ncbi:hypothetical protein PHMEG_00024499 [Phytophthora megakarya]|uniref:DUF4246 domain-containing protein n=1 Tax=Phytophthora megakarya TaxID=4795 RepID=A0A225VFM0_9STRA|nr:hypothetical protein PHMEG_00024499 [Phytophthora megakarya]